MKTKLIDCVRGYAAADNIISRFVKEAQRARPRGKVRKDSAAFRAGFFQGLVTAHAMLSLGQFPTLPENAVQIKKELQPK